MWVFLGLVFIAIAIHAGLHAIARAILKYEIPTRKPLSKIIGDIFKEEKKAEIIKREEPIEDFLNEQK